MDASARNAALISGVAAAGVLLLALTIQFITDYINDYTSIDYISILSRVPRALFGTLIAFGIVAISVSLGFRMSRCGSTRIWIAIAIPFVSALLVWCLPDPIEALRFVSIKLWQRFAISPSTLDSLVMLLVGITEVFLVLLGVSYAFGRLSRRWPVTPNTSLERTLDR